MSGLIKELLIDYINNRLSIEQRTDLTQAIQECVSVGLFTRLDIKFLDLFLQGYAAAEISEQYFITIDEVEHILSRVFRILEEVSDYTDESFIKRVESMHKYPQSKVNGMADYLTKHGNDFSTITLEDANV